jgi:hypothetical protein
MNATSQDIIEGATSLDSQLTQVTTDRDTLRGQVATLTGQNGQLGNDLLAANVTIGALRNRVNATVYDFLEEQMWLVAPGTAANTGTTGSAQTGAQKLPGAGFGSFSLAPQGPWADRYNFRKFAPDALKANFLYEISVMFPTAADAASSNCLELDIQQVISGRVFNAGLQLDFGEGLWRIWNRSSTPRDWVSTGSPIKRLAPLAWAHLAFMAHRDDDNVYSDAVLFNGMPIPGAAMKFSSTLEPSQPDMINIGFQLDGNKAGTPYTVAPNRIRFTTW